MESNKKYKFRYLYGVIPMISAKRKQRLEASAFAHKGVVASS